MWKKSIKILILSVFLALCMPIIACASPAEDEEEVVENSFFDYFGLDEQEFMNIEQNDSMETMFTDLSKEFNDIEDEPKEMDFSFSLEEDINEFTYLYLNKGFDKRMSTEDYIMTDNKAINVAPTFSSSKNISGNGDEGITVGVLVYDGYTAEGNLEITYQSDFQTIGPSNIFNETIEFNTIGLNNIIIAVMKDGLVEHKIYVVNRKEKETKEKLENIEVEFISVEEDKDKTETEETFDFSDISENIAEEGMHEVIEEQVNE